MDFGPHPDFSWSRSRHEALRTCPRRYYHHYYGSWKGWEADAAPDARHAYRLKKLTGLRAELGRSLHRRAHDVGFRVAQGLEAPPLPELLDRTRSELNEVVKSSRDPAAFRRRPAQRPFLRSAWYGDGPEEEEIERVRDRLDRTHATLHGHPIWTAVGRGELEVAVLPDPDVRPEPAFRLDEVPVYAEPDLVLRRVADDALVVVDWKSGRERSGDGWQAALAAAGVRRETGETPRLARVEYLATGDGREVELDAEILDAALDRARQSVEEMRRYLEDPDENRPGPAGDFPLTARRSACGWCGFYELCEEELRERDGTPPPGPGGGSAADASGS